ncbi:MAG: tRNA pseudouridine(13) synthase TruD [Candidatus Micrarchaeota archaeon]
MRKFSFKPEEFLVEEVISGGTILELDKQFDLGTPEHQQLENNYFTHFVLQKNNWNSMQAVNAIAHRLHAKPSRFNFAGTKDKNAITTQLCSAFCIEPARLLSIHVKDVSINGAWKSSAKVKLGDLQGNRFTITLTKENTGLVELPSTETIKIQAESHNLLFPNFFGTQRFGSMRENTHLVGEFLLKGDFHGAVLNYLAYTDDNERDEESKAARKRLATELNFTEALNYYPRHLRFERDLLYHLAANPNDFVGALQKFPRNLQLMFVHAFQSYLFNLALQERVKQDAEWSEDEEANLVGLDSQVTDAEAALLAEKGLTQESFKFTSMPWLSSRGSKRKLFVKAKDFAVLNEEPPVLRFALDSGCYATVFLDYLLS